MMEAKKVKVTKLRALRAEAGLTVEELAKLSGFGRSTIYRYESKQLRISRRSAIKICTALGIEETLDLDEIVEVDKRWLHGNTCTFS